MSNYEEAKQLISAFSGNDRTLTIPVIYIELTGDMQTAALLNQIVFWSDKSKRNDGFFYKTYTEWEGEVHLSEYQIRRSAKVLEKLGFIEMKLKRANGSPTLHYKLNFSKLSVSILEFIKNRNGTNLRNESEETQETLTVDYTVDYTVKKKTARNSAKAKYDETSPYILLSKDLFNRIKRNNDEAKEPNYQTWADDFRKLVELDGKSVDNVRMVIEWCQQDNFWKANILSAKKLREKYDQLKVQSGKFSNPGNQTTVTDEEMGENDKYQQYLERKGLAAADNQQPTA